MLNSVITEVITISSFLICILTAVVLGLLSALVLRFGAKHSSSWTQSIALLPPIVTLVIMLVNGNVGAGLAVAGAFALVRFRSLPGTAKEITGLFLTVSIGLACGMGYVVLAAIFFAVMAVYILVLELTSFGEGSQRARMLKITIPENLDYEGLFDDLLEQYTKRYELVRVRTTNMGTLFELSYQIELRQDKISKQFIDDIRCRNGNLNVIFDRQSDADMM